MHYKTINYVISAKGKQKREKRAQKFREHFLDEKTQKGMTTL